MRAHPQSKNIHFHFLKVEHALKRRNLLKTFLARLFKAEHCALSRLDIVFCADAYLLRLNQRELNHDFYTDILTFPFSGQGLPTEADIYISVDRVRENARLFSCSIESELLRVIFHGCLHLCGYGDKTAKEKKRMRERENHYLNRFRQVS